ncbi:MAG: hypothetical protein HFF79_01335 [Oscillospiraceae bacterium]|nr:hypothetical protein [Oscillospiraceae bacterium]MCI8877763.1 hypothetical protein [Oscillospiraceae bacterium]
MPELLGVTNPVPGHDNANINRNLPNLPGDPRLQNAPDPSRVSGADNRTERQDTGDAASGGGTIRYDSNFTAFLQRLASTPGLAESMAEVLRMYQGTVVSSGVGEGMAVEMAALLEMLRMDEGQLGEFLKNQMASGNRFGGALFSVLREAYGSTTSEAVKSSILQFLKRYSDYSSSQHIQGNLLRTLTKLTRAIPASWGNQLLTHVSQLEQSMGRGDRAGALRLLQGTILPFLAGYTAKTNDMGLSRMLISMLALDVARYENGSKDGLLQAFHQLTANNVLREKLGGLSDAALLHMVEHSDFSNASAKDQFAQQLARAAQWALRGGAGSEAQEAFRNILSAFLVNESVYMPLNHMIFPLDWDGKMMFSEMWVDPDAEENMKRGKGGRDNTIRFLFKMDIQGLGFFDMVLSCQRDSVDLQVYCPEPVAPFSDVVRGELTRILTENGLNPAGVQVRRSEKPLTISGVFPKIFQGANSIDVKA